MWPRVDGFLHDPPMTLKQLGRPRKVRKRQRFDDIEHVRRIKRIIIISCRYCKEIGHNRRCPQLQREYAPQQQTSRKGGRFVRFIHIYLYVLKYVLFILIYLFLSIATHKIKYSTKQILTIGRRTCNTKWAIRCNILKSSKLCNWCYPTTPNSRWSTKFPNWCCLTTPGRNTNYPNWWAFLEWGWKNGCLC